MRLDTDPIREFRMRFNTDNDHVIADQDFVVEVDMRPLLSTPNGTVSEPEVTETVQELSLDHAMSVQEGCLSSEDIVKSRQSVWFNCNRNHVVVTRGTRDNPIPVPCESLAIKDHFQARFGERLHHRFKLRRSRVSRLTKILELQGPSSRSRSELLFYAGGRSRVVGRGHHGPRSGRSGHHHHLGCHRLLFRPLEVKEDGKDLVVGRKYLATFDGQFSVDRSSIDEQAATTSVDSAADIISRLSLNEDMKSAASVDNGMGMRMIEHEKLSIMFEAPVKQPEVPIFEVSKLSLI